MRSTCIRLGLLSFLSNAASTRAPARLPPTSPGARDVARHGRARVVLGRIGSRWRHRLSSSWTTSRVTSSSGMLWGRVGGWSGCGGGGAGCVSCCVSCFSSTWWSMSLLCRSSTWDCPALGQGCLARYCARQVFWSRQCSSWSSAVAVLGQGVDMPVVATRCTRVQFLDKVVTCPLLRRLVHEGAVLGQGGDMPVVATTGA